MIHVPDHHDLAPVLKKVSSGETLAHDEAMRLYDEQDLLLVGALADLRRRKIVGDEVTFIQSLHLNPSNVCEAQCRHCDFRRSASESDSYVLGLPQIQEAVKPFVGSIQEIHLVGGLNGQTDLVYYQELFGLMKSWGVAVHALTAPELERVARSGGLVPTLQTLKEAGLSVLAAGASEPFDPQIRAKVCPDKITGERWIDLHRHAHRLGIKSHASLLVGLGETPEQRVDHLFKLRALQDETGGFLSFTLHLTDEALTGFEALRNLAVARLVLDNVPHMRAPWADWGPKLAQVALAFGADDLGSSGLTPAHRVEEITLASERMVQLIEQAGRQAVERDSLFKPVRVYQAPAPVALPEVKSASSAP